MNAHSDLTATFTGIMSTTSGQKLPTTGTASTSGKSFYIEKFLDSHFDNRHSDTILKVQISMMKI